MIKGALQQLLGTSDESRRLRENFVFKVRIIKLGLSAHLSAYLSRKDVPLAGFRLSVKHHVT